MATVLSSQLTTGRCSVGTTAIVKVPSLKSRWRRRVEPIRLRVDLLRRFRRSLPTVAVGIAYQSTLPFVVIGCRPTGVPFWHAPCVPSPFVTLGD
jgi:hypothetical protein